MATYRLTELEIDRVDLVDKGANPEAHVTLYKRRGGKSKSVTVPAALAKVGAIREGRTSLQKGHTPDVVVDEPETPQAWCKALPRIVTKLADGVAISADEATTREVLALMPATFPRLSRLSAPGVGAGRALITLEQDQTIQSWDRAWQRSAELRKARETEAPKAPAEVPKGDAAVRAFQRLIAETEHEIRTDAISDRERADLAFAGALSLYEQAALLAAKRSPALWIAYQIAGL